MKHLIIIVPVYSVEKLKRLILYGIKKRDYSYDIVSVNDGYTDQSLNVLLNNYKDIENVSISIQNNHGVSSARNAPFKNIDAHYLFFIN